MGGTLGGAVYSGASPLKPLSSAEGGTASAEETTRARGGETSSAGEDVTGGEVSTGATSSSGTRETTTVGKEAGSSVCGGTQETSTNGGGATPLTGN